MGGDTFFLARADTQLAGSFLSLASLPSPTLLHSSCFWTAGPFPSPLSNYVQLPLTHGHGLTRPAQKIKVCSKLMVSCSLPRPPREVPPRGVLAVPAQSPQLRGRGGSSPASLRLVWLLNAGSSADVAQDKLPVLPEPISSSRVRGRQMPESWCCEDSARERVVRLCRASPWEVPLHGRRAASRGASSRVRGAVGRLGGSAVALLCQMSPSLRRFDFEATIWERGGPFF